MRSDRADDYPLDGNCQQAVTWKPHPKESGYYWFIPVGETVATVVKFCQKTEMVERMGSDCPHFCYVSGEFTVPEGKYWGPLVVPV